MAKGEEQIVRHINDPVQEKINFSKTAKSGYSWEIQAATPARVLELHNALKKLFPDEPVNPVEKN